MKKNRYIILCLIIFVAAIVLLFPDTHVMAEKKVLKSKTVLVKGASKTSRNTIVPAQLASTIAEIEPNNDEATAQLINPPSPVSIEGQIDTTDVGELGIEYDESSDDFEDLFKVIISSPGINVTLANFQSDLDIFIFDESLLIHDLSNESDVTSEVIANDTLQAGTYFIGVSIYDPDTDGPITSGYTLTVTGDLSFPTSVSNKVIPAGYRLSDNYPNPFNPSTKISYSVAETGHVLLKIYNALGQEIATLVDKLHTAGTYESKWTGIDFRGNEVPSGLYFFKLTTSNFSQTKKMLFMK